MKQLINPFKPHAPIYSGLFSGRKEEIAKMDNAMFQTKHGNPTNLLFVGERGIGKTSLLLLAKYIAQGLKVTENIHNFITIEMFLNPNCKLAEFISLFQNSLKREIYKINNTKKVLDNILNIINRVEISGTKINTKNESNIDSLGYDFIYSLIDTVKTLTSGSNPKDGLVVIIDEVDTASRELNLGTFLKVLTEKMVFEDCNKILFIVAGLPSAVDRLRDNHESALRLFEEYELSPLTKEDVTFTVQSAIHK